MSVDSLDAKIETQSMSAKFREHYVNVRHETVSARQSLTMNPAPPGKDIVGSTRWCLHASKHIAANQEEIAVFAG
ncbi:hypothetical protein [Caballeronia sp. M1242]|nr:hypothetical protein [Caballeronia sp. M1242]QSN62762.1 hypothetical protein JYK05_16525 [Caballeronia sp. M1242]